MVIIADIKNFTFAHKIFVLDGNDIKGTFQTSIKDMPELICELVHKYDCQNIKLSGPIKIGEKISEKIKNTYYAKFASEHNLNIECL